MVYGPSVLTDYKRVKSSLIAERELRSCGVGANVSQYHVPVEKEKLPLPDGNNYPTLSFRSANELVKI